MNDEEFLKNLISDKVSDMSEIEHHLMEYCNLSCSFCHQDHDSKEGMETVVEKAAQTVSFIRNSPLKKHTINLMGGEIFNDLIPYKLFTDYYRFYEIVRDACLELGVEFRINFVTNLIFSSNRTHVDWLMEKIPREHAMISTSYDFAGRGLDINRSLMFKKNIEHYKERIGVVGFVLTRPSIRKLIADKDRFFREELYGKFPLYFDWYVPGKTAEKNMPSELETLNALRFVADHYPQIEPVKSLLEKAENKLTCFSLNKTTILPDGKEVTCRYNEAAAGSFLNDVDYGSNANIISSHLERNECLSCEHFSRCQMRCFVAADWATLERLPTCLFKTFFDEYPLK